MMPSRNKRKAEGQVENELPEYVDKKPFPWRSLDFYDMIRLRLVPPVFYAVNQNVTLAKFMSADFAGSPGVHGTGYCENDGR